MLITIKTTDTPAGDMTFGGGGERRIVDPGQSRDLAGWWLASSTAPPLHLTYRAMEQWGELSVRQHH